MKDRRYNVTIYLNDNQIKSTDCECPRGVYKCSHAAALFLHGYHNLSRTDVECAWKKPKTKEVTHTVEQMYQSTMVKEFNPFKEEPSDAGRARFYDDLKAYGQFTGLAWLLSPEPVMKENILPIATVEEIIVSKEFVSSGLSLEFLLRKLQVSEGQRVAVHKATIGQRENPNWQRLRRGRLTASNFGHVLQSKRVTPSLIKRVMGQYDLSRVRAIAWGISNEEEGVKAFESAMGKRVQNSGLWLSASGILGASPDGLIGGNEILEVKCPFTQRNMTIDEAISTCKDFFCLKRMERLNLRPSMFTGIRCRDNCTSLTK